MLDRFRMWRYRRRLRRIRDRAIEIAVPMVAQFEGFRQHSYQCSAGVWTIGYGSTHWPSAGGGPAPVRAGEHVQEHEAREMLRRDVGDCVGHALVMTAERGDLPTPGEIAGIASLIYNVGPGPVKRSRFLANWNGGFTETAKVEFLDFDKARIDGRLRPVKGLTRRREREWAVMTGGK